MKEPCVKIALDLHSPHEDTVVTLKQGDMGQKIEITLCEGGFPYEIEKDCYAVLTATKPDGSILYNHCRIEGNTLMYEVTEQTTAAAGRMLAEVKLYGPDDALVTSAVFRVIVNGTLYSDALVTSRDEVSALTHLVSEAAQVIQTGNETIEQGQTTILQTEAATQDALTAAAAARQAAEETNAFLEDARSRADSTVDRANDAITDAGTAIRDANDALAVAEAASEAADRTHAEAQAALTVANTAAETAGNAARDANTAARNADAAADNANAAAEETRNSGKELVQTANAAIEEIRQTAAARMDVPFIVGTAAGETVLLDDAAERTVQGMKLYGKTTQSGTPSPEAPAPLVSAGDGGSIAVSVLGENMLYPELFEQGSLLANGSETNSTTRLRSRYVYVKPNQLYSLKADGLLLYELMEFDDTRSMLKLNSISAAEFTFTTAAGTKAIRLLLRHADNTSVTTVSDVAHIQMAAGSAVSENLPYREPQTLTVPTPNGLPGIPVTSGGNYTDSTGQQWVCDEMDFDRGVYVQRVTKFVFNGAESWYLNNDTNTPETINRYFLANILQVTTKSGHTKGVLASIGVYDGNKSFNFFDENTIHAWGFPTQKGWIGFAVSKDKFPDATAFKNRLTELSTAGNPFTVYIAENIEPIEIPLSDIDLSALRTYYPNTTVFNDAGAGMKVQYVADTKRYIDKKFDQLAAAIVSN